MINFKGLTMNNRKRKSERQKVEQKDATCKTRWVDDVIFVFVVCIRS